jgi:hypothetical protein
LASDKGFDVFNRGIDDAPHSLTGVESAVRRDHHVCQVKKNVVGH